MTPNQYLESLFGIQNSNSVRNALHIALTQNLHVVFYGSGCNGKTTLSNLLVGSGMDITEVNVVPANRNNNEIYIEFPNNFSVADKPLYPSNEALVKYIRDLK